MAFEMPSDRDPGISAEEEARRMHVGLVVCTEIARTLRKIVEDGCDPRDKPGLLLAAKLVDQVKAKFPL